MDYSNPFARNWEAWKDRHPSRMLKVNSTSRDASAKEAPTLWLKLAEHISGYVEKRFEDNDGHPS